MTSKSDRSKSPKQAKIANSPSATDSALPPEAREVESASLPCDDPVLPRLKPHLQFLEPVFFGAKQ